MSNMCFGYVSGDDHEILKKEYLFLLEEYKELSVRAARLQKKLDAAQDEVPKLRPPEPKFKVGQIVVFRDGNDREMAYTVRFRRFTGGSWQYANQRDYVNTCWVNESRLRVLTKEEYGCSISLP